MTTRENINSVIENIEKKDKKRILTAIKNNSFEYVVLRLHICNAGSIIETILTNHLERYYNESDNGNCILSIEDEVFGGLL